MNEDVRSAIDKQEQAHKAFLNALEAHNENCLQRDLAKIDLDNERHQSDLEIFRSFDMAIPGRNEDARNLFLSTKFDDRVKNDPEIAKIKRIYVERSYDAVKTKYALDLAESRYLQSKNYAEQVLRIAEISNQK